MSDRVPFGTCPTCTQIHEPFLTCEEATMARLWEKEPAVLPRSPSKPSALGGMHGVSYNFILLVYEKLLLAWAIGCPWSPFTQSPAASPIPPLTLTCSNDVFSYFGNPAYKRTALSAYLCLSMLLPP